MCFNTEYAEEVMLCSMNMTTNQMLCFFWSALTLRAQGHKSLNRAPEQYPDCNATQNLRAN